MERLTQKIDGGTTWATVSAYENSRQFVLGEAINRLAAYEDTGLTPEAVERYKEALSNITRSVGEGLQVINSLTADGQLVVLPCAIGTEVWRVNFDKRRRPIEELRFDVPLYYLFGKTVFLTREEAEAALKEAGT